MASYFIFFCAALKHGQHMIKYAMRQGCVVKSNGSPWWGEGGNDELRQESERTKGCLGRKRRTPRR